MSETTLTKLIMILIIIGVIIIPLILTELGTIG